MGASGASGAGSIPAHAGEPWAGAIGTTSSEVYPRPRGGTAERERERKRLGGLSPPTRGNLGRVRPGRRGNGSIPAHAGEP